MNYKIKYKHDTEYDNFEAYEKGYRLDTVVIIGEKEYNLYIIDIGRLYQDVNADFKDNGVYITDPNMVIVKEVTKKEIEKTISKLYISGYFNRLGYMTKLKPSDFKKYNNILKVYFSCIKLDNEKHYVWDAFKDKCDEVNANNRDKNQELNGRLLSEKNIEELKVIIANCLNDIPIQWESIEYIQSNNTFYCMGKYENYEVLYSYDMTNKSLIEIMKRECRDKEKHHFQVNNGKLYYINTNNNICEFDIFTKKNGILDIKARSFKISNNKIVYFDAEKLYVLYVYDILDKRIINEMTLNFINFLIDDFYIDTNCNFLLTVGDELVIYELSTGKYKNIIKRTNKCIFTNIALKEE